MAKNINLNPPTVSDQNDVNQHKDSISRKIQQQNSISDKSKSNSVTPLIVDASQYEQTIEVRSYIPSIYESGGICTVSFMKGSDQLTKIVPALEDATTVRCTNLDVSRSEFTAGNWTVYVSYSSPSTSGTSLAGTFIIN